MTQAVDLRTPCSYPRGWGSQKSLPLGGLQPYVDLAFQKPSAPSSHSTTTAPHGGKGETRDGGPVQAPPQPGLRERELKHDKVSGENAEVVRR